MRTLHGTTWYATMLWLMCLATSWAGETEEDPHDFVSGEVVFDGVQLKDDKHSVPVRAWVVCDTVELKNGDQTVHTLHLGDMVEVLQTRSATVELRHVSQLKELSSGWAPGKAVMYKEDAWRYFSGLLERGEHLAQAYYGRAMVRCGTENPPETVTLLDSRQDLTHAIHLDKDYISAHIERAAINMYLNITDEAIADLDVVIRHGPGDVWGYENRAKCHARIGEALAAKGDAEQAQCQYQQARDDYNVAIQLAPQSPAPYARRADVYIALSEYDQAIRDLDRARELRFDRAIDDLYARAMLGQERYREVISIVDDANDRGTAFGDGYLCKGQAHLVLGQYGPALAAYEKASKHGCGKDYEAWKAIPWILATSPDARYRDGARALTLAVQVCLRIALDTEAAHFDHMKLTEEPSGRFQREWIREGWRDWRCFDVLAAAYAECGEFQEAIAWQEKVVKLAPEEYRLEVEQRLSLYQEQRPYRMQSPSNRTVAGVRSKASPTGSVVSACRYRRLRHVRRGRPCAMPQSRSGRRGHKKVSQRVAGRKGK